MRIVHLTHMASFNWGFPICSRERAVPLVTHDKCMLALTIICVPSATDTFSLLQHPACLLNTGHTSEANQPSDTQRKSGFYNQDGLWLMSRIWWRAECLTFWTRYMLWQNWYIPASPTNFPCNPRQMAYLICTAINSSINLVNGYNHIYLLCRMLPSSIN